MKHKHEKSKLVIALTIGLMSGNASATEFNKLEDSWYVGGAVGLSSLKPIPSTGFDVTDDQDVGIKIYGGVNLTDQIGLEAFWTDLGAAEVSGTGGVTGDASYKALGVNAVYKPPVKIGIIQPFGKIGAAKMTTKSSGNISINQENQFSVFGGIGVDAEINKNFAVRAEFEYFTEDANQVSVGVKWTPRGHIEKEKKVPVALPYNFGVQPTKVITRVVTPPPKVITRVVKPLPPKVEIMNKSLAGASSFTSGSAFLTNIGKQNIDNILNQIRADKIKVHHVNIVGHTDNIGRPKKNVTLSERRAQSVADYFAQRGISRGSMTILGAGESQPIASNRTAHGRAQNRRVEIAVSGSKTLIK